MKNFEGLKHFKPDSSDVWGDPSKMSRDLLVKLDDLRDHLGSPLKVTSGFRIKEGSQHANGFAVDVIAPTLEWNLHDFYLQAERFGFNGIGVYPHWKINGKVIGGLHLDIRTGTSARWMGVMVKRIVDGNEKYVQEYVGLTSANLKAWGVV